MSDTIDIEDQALKPKKVSVDGQDVEFHPLKDQIAAERAAADDTAAGSSRRGLIINKLRAPASI